jgi:hypothetical protein
MGHKILKTYLPALSISFTVIMMLAGIINMIFAENKDGFVCFIFEVFIYLVITCILDEWIGKIDFKTYIGHFLTESILLYPVTILFVIRYKWVGVSVRNILFSSIVYILVMAGIHLYFYYIEKSSAEEINRLLQERGEKNG